ncbi:metallophosphoesterase [candidate division KSB1 bacterium]|nr:metallophosphoesterase [candidate division KSB1 bacterium]
MDTNTNARFILTADTHLGFDYPLRPRVDMPRRGQDFFRNFEYIFQYALQNGIKTIFHGGDLFFRSKVPASIADTVYTMLHTYLDQGIRMYLVPGNHERSHLPSSLLATHPNLFVFDKPETITFQEQQTQIAITGFPNIRHNVRTEFPNIIAATNYQTQSAGVRILFIHQAVEGAQVGRSNFTFRNQHDVIRLADIPEHFHTVFCGHIHRYQILRRVGAYDSIPIFYPGSIERTSFSEQNEEKGFLEVGFEISSKHTSPAITSRFIPLLTRPMIELIIEPNVTTKTVIPYLKEQCSIQPENAIIRIWPGSPHHLSFIRLLTGPQLRTLALENMIIKLHHSFYPDRQPLS